MTNENNKTIDGGNSGNSPAPASKAGWAYPWGYHLPCYTTVDSTSAHTCNKSKRYGNFIVNEGASHYDD